VLRLSLPDCHRPSVWDASDVFALDTSTAKSLRQPTGTRWRRRPCRV
jgi:hypothetical protein